MSIMVKFELQAQEHKADDIKAFFENILQGTRDFSGNEGAKIARASEDNNRLVLIEYWQSNDDFQKYLDWRKEIGDFAKLASMLTQEPDIQNLDVLENA